MDEQSEMLPEGPTEVIDADFTVGQDNIRPLGLDIHSPVFVISALTILVFVVVTLALPESAGEFFKWLRPFLTSNSDWFFLGSANIFVLLALVLMVSPFGSIRIGGPNARPDYSYVGWFAMLFAAGMGIGLMFFGVAEPLSHFGSSLAADAGTAKSWAPLAGAAGDPEKARHLAMSASIYHWALHPWARVEELRME